MRTLFFGLGLVVLFGFPAAVLSHNGGITATAVPVNGIVVDGSLDDWPEDMEWYLLALNSGVYGPTDLDGQDLRHSHDLSARFTVGYNLDENLIYLAIRVRDDAVVYSPQDPWHTDACEIYLDGAHRGMTVPLNTTDAATHADLQYLICPGERTWAGAGNPGLFAGNIGLTRTTGAWVRHGNQTVYELALEAFDRYPDVPSVLTPGTVLGFDLTVVDKDSQGEMHPRNWTTF